MKTMAANKLLCAAQKTEPGEQPPLQVAFHLQGNVREIIALFDKCNPNKNNNRLGLTLRNECKQEVSRGGSVFPPDALLIFFPSSSGQLT